MLMKIYSLSPSLKKKILILRKYQLLMKKNIHVQFALMSVKKIRKPCLATLVGTGVMLSVEKSVIESIGS